MKLGIGTVQFGLDYGIANRTGRATRSDAVEILGLAARTGICVIDTAPAYGSSEETLGELLPAEHAFRLVTKTVPFDAGMSSQEFASKVRAGFQNSLARLRTERVYGMLVHHAFALESSGAGQLMRVLEDLKREGRVAKVGVSVYHPRQLEEIMNRFAIDLVQLPFNLYDQRFAQSGLLQRLNKAGVEVHARSAFLQGLLLLPPDRLPERFRAIRAHHARLHRQISEAGRTPASACLSFCLAQADIDHVIVGCEKVEQLVEIIAAAKGDHPHLFAAESYAIDDETIVDPSTWSR